MDYLSPVDQRERLLQRRWRWSEREDLQLMPVAGVRESVSEGGERAHGRGKDSWVLSEENTAIHFPFNFLLLFLNVMLDFFFF